MIIMLRGTSGSGKSYIAFRVMDALGDPDDYINFGPRNRRGGYIWNDHLTLIGRYETACGGCDGFSWPGCAGEIEALVQLHALSTPHVLLEGLMVSSWGGDRLRRLGPDLTVIHLSTFLEDCLAAVNARRAARSAALGKDLGPVNPFNTTKKYEGLLTASAKHRREGIRVETLDRTAALARTFELLGIAA